MTICEFFIDGVEDFWNRCLLATLPVVLIGISVAFMLAPEPPPQSFAGGVYVNECCGSILFKTGTLKIKDQTIPHELENIKGGLVAVPAYKIGVSEGRRLIVDQTKDGTYLKFKQSKATPDSMMIRDINTWVRYEFLKQ